MRVDNVSTYFGDSSLLLLTFYTELNQLTGIAAILTFPLDVEVVEAEEKAAKEAEGQANEEPPPE